MRKRKRTAALAAILLTCLCVVVQGQDNSKDKSKPSQLTIHVRDYCDPDTFNAGLGPGTCTRDTSTGAINLNGFLTEATLDKSVGAWRFVPDRPMAREGATINLQNLGGETHTFTRVKRFGGG